MAITDPALRTYLYEKEKIQMEQPTPTPTPTPTPEPTYGAGLIGPPLPSDFEPEPEPTPAWPYATPPPRELISPTGELIGVPAPLPSPTPTPLPAPTPFPTPIPLPTPEPIRDLRPPAPAVSVPISPEKRWEEVIETSAEGIKEPWRVYQELGMPGWGTEVIGYLPIKTWELMGSAVRKRYVPVTEAMYSGWGTKDMPDVAVGLGVGITPKEIVPETPYVPPREEYTETITKLFAPPREARDVLAEAISFGRVPTPTFNLEEVQKKAASEYDVQETVARAQTIADIEAARSEYRIETGAAYDSAFMTAQREKAVMTPYWSEQLTSVVEEAGRSYDAEAANIRAQGMKPEPKDAYLDRVRDAWMSESITMTQSREEYISGEMGRFDEAISVEMEKPPLTETREQFVQRYTKETFAAAPSVPSMLSYMVPIYGTQRLASERGLTSGWTVLSAIGDVAMILPIIGWGAKFGQAGVATGIRGPALAARAPVVGRTITTMGGQLTTGLTKAPFMAVRHPRQYLGSWWEMTKYPVVHPLETARAYGGLYTGRIGLGPPRGIGLEKTALMRAGEIGVGGEDVIRFPRAKGPYLRPEDFPARPSEWQYTEVPSPIAGNGHRLPWPGGRPWPGERLIPHQLVGPEESLFGGPKGWARAQAFAGGAYQEPTGVGEFWRPPSTGPGEIAGFERIPITPPIEPGRGIGGRTLGGLLPSRGVGGPVRPTTATMTPEAVFRELSVRGAASPLVGPLVVGPSVIGAPRPGILPILAPTTVPSPGIAPTPGAPMVMPGMERALASILGVSTVPAVRAGVIPTTFPSTIPGPVSVPAPTPIVVPTPAPAPWPVVEPTPVSFASTATPMEVLFTTPSIRPPVRRVPVTTPAPFIPFGVGALPSVPRKRRRDKKKGLLEQLFLGRQAYVALPGITVGDPFGSPILPKEIVARTRPAKYRAPLMPAQSPSIRAKTIRGSGRNGKNPLWEYEG